MSFGFKGRHGRRHIPGEARGYCHKRTGLPTQCICPHCGTIIEKVPGQPCFLTPCPHCQAMMAGRFPQEEQPEQTS